jgi:hypothetical protein
MNRIGHPKTSLTPPKPAEEPQKKPAATKVSPQTSRPSRDEFTSGARSQLARTTTGLDSGTQALGGGRPSFRLGTLAALGQGPGSANLVTNNATGGTAAAAPTPESSPASAQAEASAATVQRAYETGGPSAAAIALEVEVKSHPELAEEITLAAQPTIERIAQDIGNDTDNEANVQALVSLSAAASAGGPEAAQLIAGALAATIPDGDLEKIDDGFTQAILAGGGPELAIAVAAAMAASKPEGAGDVTAAITKAVDELREDYTEAADEYSELEQRLSQDLAQFGPTMTPEQRESYIAAFWADPSRAEVKSRVEHLADRLSQTLESAGPALEAAALAGNEGAGEALIDAYEQLARSPEHAAEAIGWVSHLGQSPELFEKLDGFINADLEERFSEKLLPTAIPLAQQQILAAHSGDSDATAAQAAMADFEELLGGLANAPAFDSIPGQVRPALEQAQRYARGDFSGIEATAAGYEDAGPLGQALIVASLTQGMYGQPPESDALQTLGNAIGASSTGVKLAAKLLQNFAGAAKYADNVSNFLTKIAPALSFVSDLIQLHDDINNLRDDPNVGEAIAAFGTILGLAGDVVAPIAPLSTALNIAGAAIHAIGSFISSIITGNEERDRLRDDQTRLLMQATGLDEATARELVEANPRALARLSEMGLSPAQVRELAAKENVDFSNPETWVAIRAAALFGLKGQEVLDFVPTVTGHGRFTYADNPLTWVFQALNSNDTVPIWRDGDFGPMQRQVLDVLRHYLPEAATYLEQHQGTPSVDIFGPPSYDQY